MRKWINILVWLIGACCFTASAQDYHFSQYYANPLYLSPSLAGATDGGRVVLNYRNQWPSIVKAFTTYAFSIDNFFTKFNSGLGFYLIQDRAGSAGLVTTNAAFQYSYNVQVTYYWQVVPAIQFAYGNKAIDFSKAIFPDQSPGNTGGSGAWERLANEQVNYLDMAASIFAYSSKYWMGLTVDHLARPNYSFLGEEAKAELKYVFFGGVNIWTERRRRKGKSRAFSASTRFQHQDNFNQLDAGVYWYNDPIEIGFWYRGLPFFNDAKSASTNQDAIVASLAYKFNNMRFGYSYDITTSSLGWSTAGAHEVSLLYEFNQKGSMRLNGRRPAVPCSESGNPSNGSKYKRNKRSLF